MWAEICEYVYTRRFRRFLLIGVSHFPLQRPQVEGLVQFQQVRHVRFMVSLNSRNYNEFL